MRDLRKQGFPETFVKLSAFFDDLTGGSDVVFDQLQTSRALDIYIVCTSESAGGRGIGSALMEEAANVAAKAGITSIQCMALSTYTQKICERLNFRSANRYVVTCYYCTTYCMATLWHMSGPPFIDTVSCSFR